MQHFHPSDQRNSLCYKSTKCALVHIQINAGDCNLFVILNSIAKDLLLYSTNACRTPGFTACSKTKMLHLDKVCLKS